MIKLKTIHANCFSEITVDSGSRTLRNVALVGQVSRNGRRYLADALQGAVDKYEGVKVFLDHPSKADQATGWRSVRDLAGVIEHVRFDGHKLRGDLRLLDNDGGRLTLQLAREMPSIAGMSHNAFGESRREGGTEIITRIDRVVSVDVVADPATNEGFFESLQDRIEGGAYAKRLAEDLRQPSGLDDIGNSIWIAEDRQAAGVAEVDRTPEDIAASLRG